ncbi:MAG: hypothetical protein ABJD68_07880 [Nakamurella sp.]
MSGTRYAATIDSHAVELEFDSSLIVLNRVRLFVDGARMDDATVFYGERELTATAADGVQILVKVGSGMVGEPQRPQLRRADGSWQDMNAV